MAIIGGLEDGLLELQSHWFRLQFGVQLHQVFSQVLEKLTYVIVSFGTDSNNHYTGIPGPLLLFPLDILLELVVAFICQNKYLLWITVNESILDPLDLNIIKGLLISRVIDNNDGMGAIVVGLGDVFESLLASGVPQLQLDEFLL